MKKLISFIKLNRGISGYVNTIEEIYYSLKLGVFLFWIAFWIGMGFQIGSDLIWIVGDILRIKFGFPLG